MTDRDAKRLKKLKIFTVQTCMKRLKINTIGGLSGAVHGSLVSAPDPVALRPGCAPSPGYGAVCGPCVRSQGL